MEAESKKSENKGDKSVKRKRQFVGGAEKSRNKNKKLMVEQAQSCSKLTNFFSLKSNMVQELNQGIKKYLNFEFFFKFRIFSRTISKGNSTRYFI